MSRKFVMQPSKNKLKKWMVYEELPDNTKSRMVFFGSAGYRDYPLAYKKDPEEADKLKKIYINRHSKNEDWDMLTTAGSWSRYISWNKPTIEESIKDMEDRFNIIIELRK